MHAGKQSLAHKLNQHISNNIEIIVIDALNNKDLDLIASVTASMKGKILFAGSPGFAQYARI